MSRHMVIKLKGLLVGPQCGWWAHRCSGPGANMHLLVHVNESGHRLHFDCSGRLSKNLQAVSAVAEQPREETLDGLSWNPLWQGGFAAELGLWVLQDWKPYPHQVCSQCMSHSPVRISGYQWHTGHPNSWAKVSTLFMCKRSHCMYWATNIPQNLSPSKLSL